MSDIPNDDKVHRLACYQLIRPGQTYLLTIEDIVHYEDCALSEGLIRARDDLAFEVKRDRLLIWRCGGIPPGRVLWLLASLPTPLQPCIPG